MRASRKTAPQFRAETPGHFSPALSIAFRSQTCACSSFNYAERIRNRTRVDLKTPTPARRASSTERATRDRRSRPSSTNPRRHASGCTRRRMRALFLRGFTLVALASAFVPRPLRAQAQPPSGAGSRWPSSSSS